MICEAGLTWGRGLSQQILRIKALTRVIQSGKGKKLHKA
jgi:hypothetical protein